jgi:hypothetical protein
LRDCRTILFTAQTEISVAHVQSVLAALAA